MSAPKNWQKSTFSGGGDGNNCVELAASGQSLHIHLRESDHPATELATSPVALARLLRTVKSGKLT